MNKLRISMMLVFAVIIFASCESTKLVSTSASTQPNALVDDKAQEEFRKNLIEKRMLVAKEQARKAAAEHNNATIEQADDKNAIASVNIIPSTIKTSTTQTIPTTDSKEELAVIERRKLMAERLAQARLKAKKAATEAVNTSVETEKSEVEAIIETTPAVAKKEEKSTRIPIAQLLKRRNKKTAANTVVAKVEEPLPTLAETATATEIPAPEMIMASTRPPVTKLPSTTEESLFKYYFPIEDLKEAKAYRYVLDARFERDTTYRLMKTLSRNGQTILITEIYNSNLEVKTIIKEVVNGEGGYVADYTSYEVGGFGEVNSVHCGVDISENIKWEMKEGEEVTLALNYYSSLHPNYDIRLNRNRSLVAQDAITEFNGQSFKTVVLEDAEETIYTDHRDVLEKKISLKYINHYAEGLGLVEYHVKENLKPADIYKLDDVMTFNEWMQLSKAKRPVKGN